MKKQWHIRKAVIEDSDGLHECMQFAYAGYRDRMSGVRLPPLDLDYSNEIRDYSTWVVELDGRIVGGITMMFERDHASVANVAVHPSVQGQGLGGVLMKFAEKEAKEKNYPEMRLATHVLLSESAAMYLHLGWTEVDRDENRVYMKKII